MLLKLFKTTFLDLVCLHFCFTIIVIIIIIIIIAVVTLIPTGPLYIAINTERTINCSVTGGRFNFWRVIFKSSTSERDFTVGELVPGISIISEASASSSLIVNTTDTFIIGLECNGGFSNEDVTTRINLTIYGMLINYLRE